MAQISLESNDPIVVDDRPLAVRRKRRCSTALVDPLHEPKPEPADDSNTVLLRPAKTPSKPKKKVRFSDPGPDITGLPASTGLTPAFSRTSFAPFRPQRTPRSLSQVPRRLSLPNLRANALPSPSLSPLPGPLSGEIQFAPLYQRLDDRVKRRLRRNNLSQELNEIEAEKRSIADCKHEIQTLKAELAMAKKQQMHGEADGESSASRGVNRVQALEHKLVQLKQEVQDQEGTVQNLPTSLDVIELLTPGSTIFVDDTAEDFVETDSGANGVLRDQASIADPPQYSEASTQASVQHPRDAEILRSARLSLEYLFPGEIALGLVPKDPKPLLDIMLERMQLLRTRTLIAEDSLSTTQTQESNLRTQFNAVLGQLDRARKYAEKVGAKHNNEKTRAEVAETKVEALEASAKDASTRVQILEKSTDEKDRSIQKLQEALDSYRTEVGKLELLITHMDSDHNAAVAKLKSEMDEAVADLECHVTAETIGRREAEQQLEKRDQRIKELKLRETELMTAVNEKQQIIRDTEEAFTIERERFTTERESFTMERESHERKVSTLDSQITHMRHNIRNSDKRYERADQIREILTRKLEEERQASLRAIAAVQAELAQCSRNADGIREAHVSDSKKRGADVMEHKGLLTPTTAGGRFRDAEEIEGLEGFVEVPRGKKRKSRRPDSGIVILEEDEDEDMVMTHY